MMFNIDDIYDRSNPISIEEYAQGMIGKTFGQICKDYEKNHNIEEFLLKESIESNVEHGDKRRKGGLGELVEEKFFYYKANNDSNPDFDEAGVELKVTPYRINKNGSLSAKERLIITMIDYFKVIDEVFEESHLWKKANLILLVYYLFQQEIENRLDYEISYVRLFTPPAEDIEIIKQDFEMIVEKIRNGEAHELSEGDTLYLGAAPKASTSKVRRHQPFSDILAKPRAFAFKNSYMTYILNNFIVPGKVTYEPILKGKIDKPFETYVKEKIEEYSGYTIQMLCERFGVEYEIRPKNLEAMIAYRILGIRGNQAAEFVKANIVVKTIRLGKNNKIKESMSFPTFKFKDIIKETWETSTFGSYLNETRFLFIVYKFDEDDNLRLKGCQFWHIPYKDLEQVRTVWERTIYVINQGLEVVNRNGRNYNNFPSASENPVCHVRPHARNANDTYDLPDGRKYPKQCFWLNNNYILSQIEASFLD